MPRARFAWQYLLHLTGLRRADLSEVTLSNYVAMYCDRRNTIRNRRLATLQGALLPRMVSKAADDEIRARSKELLTDELVNNPMAGGTSRAMVTKLVFDFLKAHPEEIRSVANIGASVDSQCAYLAPRFPDIEFTSVDFSPDLDKVNAYLPQSPNWKFKPGYALDMLQNGELEADLFFMTSTSVCFSPPELDAYIAAFARQGRYVIFNEPWWPAITSLNLFKIPRPEEIPAGQAILGLVYFNFQSNYLAMLERHGFNVLSSRIVPTAGASWYTLQIIAERA